MKNLNLSFYDLVWGSNLFNPKQMGLMNQAPTTFMLYTRIPFIISL